MTMRVLSTRIVRAAPGTSLVSENISPTVPVALRGSAPTQPRTVGALPRRATPCLRAFEESEQRSEAPLVSEPPVQRGLRTRCRACALHQGNSSGTVPVGPGIHLAAGDLDGAAIETQLLHRGIPYRAVVSDGGNRDLECRLKCERGDFRRRPTGRVVTGE